MYAQPVKRSVARKVTLPPIPNELAYPVTRQAAVYIPSRIARDKTATNIHIKLMIEFAAAGGDTQWIMIPTVKFLGETLHVDHSVISRSIYDLERARYIEIKRQSRQVRYARIITPGYALDWE